MFGRKKTLAQRIRRLFLYAILFFIIGGFLYFFTGKAEPADNIKWGVTYSKDFTQYLDIEWKGMYIAMLDDLQISHIRIAIPWKDVEPSEGNYNFDDYHFMIAAAQERGVGVVPVLGHRVPRWPECHTPDWARQLTNRELSEKTLALVEREVQEFKRYDNITMWQVENEPFVKFFGECPSMPSDLLGREIERVKSLDGRPIMTTDSGELGSWARAGAHADVLGVTMYRWVWNDIMKYMKYPFPPIYYARKANIAQKENPKLRVIGSELQMEPWMPERSANDVPLDEQFVTMNIEQFRENIEFAKASGFDEHYLWGVEWWYWMKEHKGDDRFWEEAKTLWEDRVVKVVENEEVTEGLFPVVE